MTTQPLKVFLCYSPNDKLIVRELYSQLSVEGWMDIWLDEKKILLGQDRDLEIKKAVKDAQAVIVCVSNTWATEEGNSQRELKLALDVALNKPNGSIFIIPLKLEECGLPFELSHLQCANYFKENRGLAYQLLLTSLRARANLPGISTATNAIQPISPKISHRVLEAAIENQVRVDTPASLFVWVKRLESKSIISVVSSIDEDVLLDEDNVKSKSFEIEFPTENGKVLPINVSLRLSAYEFTPPTQQKKIIVPPEGDSEVCTFIVTPKKAGKLLLSIEVLKHEVTLANRTLRTIAIKTEKKEPSSIVLASIPVSVFVQPESKSSNSSSVDVESKLRRRKLRELPFLSRIGVFLAFLALTTLVLVFLYHTGIITVKAGDLGNDPCPGRQNIRDIQEQEIRVKSGYIAYFMGWQFDGKDGGYFITFKGPYKGSHKFGNGTYCPPVPFDTTLAKSTEELLMKECQASAGGCSTNKMCAQTIFEYHFAGGVCNE